LARYNTFKYGSGQTYGEVAASAYSVAPFSAYAFDYQKVYLTWATPQSVSGNPVTTFQIVRNQYAYSETQTDGVILWTSSVAPSGNILYDTTQLASGRFAFYSIWLQLDDDSWVLAGTTEVLVPAKHSSRIYPKYIDETNTAVPADILLQTTHERFLSYIPKVFTSEYTPKVFTAERTPTNELAAYNNLAITDNQNTKSDLSLFLEGFSFTIDEFLTYSQLVLPGLSGKYSNGAIVKLQGNQLGVPEDTQGLTKTQKYLVRDAVYTYSRKGTAAGLNRFVKALTGYVPTITVGTNIMLSLQDSTFYNGIGNWKISNGTVSMNATNTSDVPTAGGSDLVVDNNWIATIVASSGSYPSITLGADAPILTGIPVTAGQEYTFSYWVKRNSTSGGIYGQAILWYDQHGVKINDSPTQVGQTVTTSWVKKTYTKTAPTGAVFAGLGLTFTGGPTYYLDRVQFALSSESNYSEARAIKISVASDAATRLTKIPRLNFEITKYLPINKAYFITSSSGFESSGISS
jgi:hypothetical protein